MLRELTCIICPNGCSLKAEVKETSEGALEILSIEGASCPRGTIYAKKELTSPERNIATSVPVKGGELPLVSVRLTKPIPKAHIFDAMAEMKKCVLTAPVASGTVLIHGLLGYDADVITTKDIKAVK